MPLCKSQLPWLHGLLKMQAGRLGSPRCTTTELDSEAHVGNQTPELPLLTGLVLWSWTSSRTMERCSLKPVWEIRSQGSHYLKTVPLCLKTVPLCLKYDCTTLLEPTPGKQAPELLLKYWIPAPAVVSMAPESQQASLRTHAAYKLGSPIPGSAATASRSPHSSASRLQGLHWLVGTRW
jgi:hypothetical protein